MNILTTTSNFDTGGFPEEFKVIKNPYKRKLTEDESIQLYQEYKPVGIIAGVEPITRRVLEAGKQNGLRVISRCGVGVDSIDLMAAKELGIIVRITPNAPVVSVAELTLSLILAVSRNLINLDKLVRDGGWKGNTGFLVSGKTVGIIGCGRIGSYVAKLLKAMGCNILGYDPYINSHDICKMSSFETLMTESDIITLHIPYTKENHHIINKNVIDRMKPGAIIINCARGGLIDEEALYNALKEGKLAGAGLDCFENEPYRGKLCELDNVIMTPHAGSSAKEGRALMEAEARDNLIEELNKLF